VLVLHNLILLIIFVVQVEHSVQCVWRACVRACVKDNNFTLSLTYSVGQKAAVICNFNSTVMQPFQIK